jgi:hypothetical protein
LEESPLVVRTRNALRIALTLAAFVAAADAFAAASYNVGALLDAPATSFGALLAQNTMKKLANPDVASSRPDVASQKAASAPQKLAGVDGPKRAKIKEVSTGVSVTDLDALGAISFADLVARANGKAVDAAPAAKTKVVSVTIGTEPDAEPEAVVTTAAKAQAVAAAHRADTLSLTITEAAGALRFAPQSLVLPHARASAKVVLADGLRSEGLNIFVRDQSVVAFDQASMELTAKQKGATEVYAVMRGKMYIVPVSVDGAGDVELKVPDALVSLDGVFGGQLGSALYPGLEQATNTSATAGDKDVDGPSVDESLAETAETAREVQADATRYTVEGGEPSYKPFTIQVVDERSAPQAGRVYPVSGAIVRVAGTEFAARTDATGHLTIRDVPTDARLMLRIDDGGGIIRPAVAEVSTRASKAGRVTRVKVVRNFSFDAYASIAGVAQESATGTNSATLYVQGATPKVPPDRTAVTLDAQAQGPFYFNRYGFLDRSLHATGPDGRVCFYNVLAGPMALTVYQDGALVASLPVAAYANRHVEDEIPIDTEARLTVRLAAAATAHEQLGADPRAANGLKTIDMIDLIPLGTSDAMMQLAPGRVTTNEALVPVDGRFGLYAQAAEFEPTVYTLPVGREGVVPLMPRGFLEDMSVYAQVVYNPDQGVVLVEYAPKAGGDEGVTVKLVDAEGRDAGEAWTFAGEPVAKALFFNVPAGTYQVMATTRDGFWLGADTVAVYNETLSYTRLGGQLRYRP